MPGLLDTSLVKVSLLFGFTLAAGLSSNHEKHNKTTTDDTLERDDVLRFNLRFWSLVYGAIRSLHGTTTARRFS